MSIPKDSPINTVNEPSINQQDSAGGSAAGKGVHRMGNTHGDQVDNTQEANIGRTLPTVNSTGGGYKGFPNGSFVPPGKSAAQRL